MPSGYATAFRTDFWARDFVSCQLHTAFQKCWAVGIYMKTANGLITPIITHTYSLPSSHWDKLEFKTLSQFSSIVFSSIPGRLGFWFDRNYTATACWGSHCAKIILSARSCILPTPCIIIAVRDGWEYLRFFVQGSWLLCSLNAYLVSVMPGLFPGNYACCSN